jgi:hypothetical protein
MQLTNFIACLSVVASVTAALSAQAPLPAGKADRKTIQSIRVHVIGCVVGSRLGEDYRLTNAVMSGDDVAATTGTAAKVGSGKDVSFENSPSYDLIGGQIKGHLGHKIEVVGITSDTKMNNSDSFSSAIGSSSHERATLTVTSVRMIAATCP